MRRQSRRLPLRLPEHRTRLVDLMETSGTDISAERAAALIEKWVPRSHWMTLRRIICLPTEEAVRRANRETNALLRPDDLGQFVFHDATIVLNMPAIGAAARKEAGSLFSLEETLPEVFWTTLLHELRHVHQHNPLMEACFAAMSEDEREGDAESWCWQTYGQMRAQDDCQVFRRFRRGSRAPRSRWKRFSKTAP